MTELNRDEGQEKESRLESKIEHLDADLNILERHAGEVAQVEDAIQEDMRKRDREYKDARFHSVPKSRKHVR